MSKATSRRPATPFGHGILDDEPQMHPETRAALDNVTAALAAGSSHGAGVGPDVLFDEDLPSLCPDCGGSGGTRGTKGHASVCPSCGGSGTLGLPPLSGGSDAATAEAEVHHGDDYCPECDAFHTPHLTPSDHGYYAAFSGALRSDAPKGADREGWLEGYDECVAQRGEPVKRGPTPEDVAFAMGLSAAIESRRPVDPPAGLSDMEWRAFNAGASAGMAEVCERLMDEAMRAEVDAEMASVYAGGF